MPSLTTATIAATTGQCKTRMSAHFKHKLLVSTILLAAAFLAAAEPSPSPSEPSRPCRLHGTKSRPTSPPKPTVRFFRSPKSRSSEATTTPALTTMPYANESALSIAAQQHTNYTTVNCQCKADYIRIMVLLAVVIGTPVAVYICTAVIRAATRIRYANNWTYAKTPALGISGEAAETRCDPETTWAATNAEAAAISRQEHASLTADETTAKAVTFQPYLVSEPPSPYSAPHISDADAMTSNPKSHYRRPTFRTSRWPANLSRQGNSRPYRKQKPVTQNPVRTSFANLRPPTGSPPFRQFGYGRPPGPTCNRTQPRGPTSTSQPRRPKPSLPFRRPAQLALAFYILLACSITPCSATDPAAEPTTSILAGTSKVILALLMLLMNAFETSSSSPHGNTPPTDATYAAVNQLQLLEARPEQISQAPAEIDLSLDVPLLTPPSPSPPPSPPAMSPPSPTNNVPEEAISTPKFASVLSRYPTDTAVFVLYSAYVIIFETTTSEPSWIRAASRYSKTRLTNAIRDASRRNQAVIVINSDLPENIAVSTGCILRQLKSVTELLLPNNLPFLLQANAFAFISLRSAFPLAVRTTTFAADSIKPTAIYQTPEDALHAALQAVCSTPILERYSDEDAATSLSRRAPSAEKHTSGKPSRLDTPTAPPDRIDASTRATSNKWHLL